MKAKLSLIAAALALAASCALAQPGPGYGPGSGYGPGGGPGGNYGPGMMGGYGYGPGMMGGYGYGPGYGRGMMGGGYGALASLKLTPEQSEKIAAIREESRKKNWGAMGEMRSEMFKLQRLFSADTLDTKAVTEQQKKVDALRMQMLTSRLESQKQIEAVLTPEQRKQFREFRPWWMHGEDGE